LAKLYPIKPTPRRCTKVPAVEHAYFRLTF
jgi:hypothetical protein